MALLIDGYNLLHAAGLMGRRLGPGGLERARKGLLSLLASSLTPEEIAKTVVVFDAGPEAPRDRPRAELQHGIQVRYSELGEEADDELERLIAADSAPRQLTVVSGDHRLQRAARRRKARAVDSEAWLTELEGRRHAAKPIPPGSLKPTGPLSADEVEDWLREFGME
jgi:predicted RNA-binding protein with PIN domain